MANPKNLKQGTDEWMNFRLGKVTASRVADVMATTKSGTAASRKNYMMELLCQRLTGKFEQVFVSAAMQRGTEKEPLARSSYEVYQGVLTVEVGCFEHPKIIGFIASPDALVGEDGLLEIKSPNTATHIDFLRTGKPDGRYVWQMMAQMSCTGRNWCDFVSFDDRLPENLQYRKVRVMRDDSVIKKMESEIESFLVELETLIEELTKVAA